MQFRSNTPGHGSPSQSVHKSAYKISKVNDTGSDGDEIDEFQINLPEIKNRHNAQCKHHNYFEKMMRLNKKNPRYHLVEGLPDMEFSLTPVPGAVKKPGNIY